MVVEFSVDAIMNMEVVDLYVELNQSGLISQQTEKVLQKSLEKAINENLPTVSTVDNVGTALAGEHFDDGAYWKLLEKYEDVIVEEALSI